LPDAPDREKELAVREKETPDGDKEAPGRVKEASDCVPAFHLQGNAEQTAFHKLRASSSSRADLASVGLRDVGAGDTAAGVENLRRKPPAAPVGKIVAPLFHGC